MKNSVKYQHFTGSAFSPLDRSSYKTLLAREAEESPFNGFIPLSPIKSDLRKSSGEDQLLIQGRILDKSGSWPVGNAGIEIWHLTPGTIDFKHRAKLVSDSSGVFQLITDLPARQKGHNFKINFKITAGVNSYYTQLSFNHSMAWLASRSNRQFNNQVKLSNLQPGMGDHSIFDLEIRLNR